MNELVSLLIARYTYLLVKVVPLLIIGVSLANVLGEFGVAGRLGFLVRPLTHRANLPDEAADAITTCIVSVHAGYAMLADYYKRGILGEAETLIATFMNTFFNVIHLTIIYYVPVVVPLVGVATATIYVGARLCIALAITLTAVLLGYVFLPRRTTYTRTSQEEDDDRSREERVKDGVRGAWGTIKKILPRLFIVYTLVALLVATGYLDQLSGVARPATSLSELPWEVAPIIATQILDPTSGFVLAGALLQENQLPAEIVAGALLLGNLLSLSVTYVKQSVPTRIAYFGTRMGLKVALYNLGLTLAFTAVALVIIL